MTDPGEPLTVVACAAESGRRAAVLKEAIAECKRRAARLILYDVDAPSLWVDSFPEFDAKQYQHPLSPSELRGLGRTRLAVQVEQVRAEGIDGYAWLPHEHSADALVTYAAGHGAKTIMLSRELEEPTFRQRLQHLTAEGARVAAGGRLEVRLVAGDEAWTPESEMATAPVNAIDTAFTSALGSSLLASRLLTAMGLVLLAIALLLAGAAIFVVLPVPTLAIAGAVAVPGILLLASARLRRA